MKNIQQIEAMLKASGLTGDELKAEFHKQALLFGNQLIEQLLVGYESEQFGVEDATTCLAHISEIFVCAARGKFYHDFAEHFQIEVYNTSLKHSSNFCNWHDSFFKDKPAGKTKKTKAEVSK